MKIVFICHVAAGIAHLSMPEPFLKITPDWVPFAPQVIFVTGLCELAGAVALVTRPLRRWAGAELGQGPTVQAWWGVFFHGVAILLSNLDPPLRAEMRGQLHLLRSQFPATMIYVTHEPMEAYPSRALPVCTRSCAGA